MNVSRTLVKWYHLNRRDLPWRETKDPYLIWLSEIILQQTRVSQGLPYYYKFIAKYPTINDLAKAPEDEVLKLWQGLGYYSRARNLLITARHIHEKLAGVFPSEYRQIRLLKGVGDYTAAAIASFAFNEPHAVVDGNVYRVLARLYGETIPVDSTAGKKLFTLLAAKILDKKSPGIHNQAIMEFGATVCRPVAPDCPECPFMENCVAFRNGSVELLPVKVQKAKVSKRYFNYLLVRFRNNIYLNQRTRGDIWEKLYDLPLIETESFEEPERVINSDSWKRYFKNKKSFRLRSVKNYPVYKLSHQHIFARLFELELTGKPGSLLVSSFIQIHEREAPSYPVPRLIETIFSDHLS